MPIFGPPPGGSGNFGFNDDYLAWSPCLNDTGDYILVDQVTLVGIASAKLAGYDDPITIGFYRDLQGLPFQKVGSTETIATWSVGNIVVPLTTTFLVGPNEIIWMAFRRNIFGATFSNAALSSGGLEPPEYPRSVYEYRGSLPTQVTQARLDTHNGYVPVQYSGTIGVNPDSPAKTSLDLVEPLTEGVSRVRTPEVNLEPLMDGYSKVKTAEANFEPLMDAYSEVRTSLVLFEALLPIEPEPFMSTEKFPGFGNSATTPSIPAAKDPFNSALPGLSIEVKKAPKFNTRISGAASGNEKRNALQEYPVWEFELSYEFLEDSSGAASSLKTIQGFFLSRLGAFDSWLFKDPDDYLVQNGFQANCDGVTTQFFFMRSLGGFVERVGQVDTDNIVTLFLDGPEAHTVPADPGPYTVVVTNAAAYEADAGVTHSGTPLTKVTGAPASGEYAVDELTGTYTFNADLQGLEVVISYRYGVNPADYTVTMPNYVVFNSAPADGLTLTADFQFFFVCRFLEDQMEFDKFMDKLWSLQTCEFRSLIQ